MKFLEKNLEDIIFDAPNDALSKRGLRIDGKKFRQLRIGNYGVADLVTVKRVPCIHDNELTRCLLITVFELKSGWISSAAFFQAISYAKGIQSYLLKVRKFNSFKINITLIGSIVKSDSSFCYLSDLFKHSDDLGQINNLSFYQYDYNIDGISFKRSTDFKLDNEGFQPKKRP